MTDRLIKVGIDVDITTLDSSRYWWQWLWRMTLPTDIPYDFDAFVRYKEQNNEPISYDLSKYFPDMINENIDKFEFWRHTGVYDTITPVAGAVLKIKEIIANDAYRVVFVTHNKGNGGRSKHMNLVRLFGKDNFDYVVTKEKHLVNIDCLIDDRNEFLYDCQARGIKTFRIMSPFQQTLENHPHTVDCADWYEVHANLVQWTQQYCIDKVISISESLGLYNNISK